MCSMSSIPMLVPFFRWFYRWHILDCLDNFCLLDCFSFWTLAKRRSRFVWKRSRKKLKVELTFYWANENFMEKVINFGFYWSPKLILLNMYIFWLLIYSSRGDTFITFFRKHISHLCRYWLLRRWNQSEFWIFFQLNWIFVKRAEKVVSKRKRVKDFFRPRVASTTQKNET